MPQIVHSNESTNLADLLERVLDKGIVIAGDIRVNLLDIELLTIKIRLLVASVDKAREIIESAHKKCLITNSITAKVKMFPDVRVAPAG